MAINSNAPKTGEKSASPQQKASTTAHLVETTAHQLAHTKRHMVAMKTSKGKAQALDYDHASTHLDGSIEHVQKLVKHIQSNYPSEGKELGKLQDSVARSDVGQRVKDAHQAIKKGK